MKRIGIHKPTIEDIIEISGIETLHPGGVALTRRTGEIAGLRPGIKVLDVSSGRGTQAIYYAKEFGAEVTGIDICEQMINTSIKNAQASGLTNKVTFQQGDSQALPFEDATFDVVLNECAVGIPGDSQKVLNEMVRVAKDGGVIVIHESTWRKKLSASEKEEISERYGTTPLEYDQWIGMLEQAGAKDLKPEFDEWSNPEMFWKIRKNHEVNHYAKVLTWPERIITAVKIFRKYSIGGVIKAFENEKVFYKAVLDGKIGYCLYKGEKSNIQT